MIVSGDSAEEKQTNNSPQTLLSILKFTIMGSDTIVFLMGWHFQVTAKKPEHSSLN